MTVRELIDRLASEDPDAVVVIQGYEADYNDPAIHRLKAVRNPTRSPAQYWFGNWEEDHGPDSHPAIALCRAWEPA